MILTFPAGIAAYETEPQPPCIDNQYVDEESGHLITTLLIDQYDPRCVTRFGGRTDHRTEPADFAAGSF